MSIKNNNYWDGVPEELRLLCDFESSFNDVKHECVAPALNYLCSHSEDCYDESSGVTVRDYLHWLEVGFDHCLFPLEIYGDDWAMNAVLINEILSKAEQMMIKENPNIYNESLVKPEADLPDSDLYEISQKITLYYCVYFSALERWGELKEKLNLLLEATKRNMRALLNRRDKLNPRAHNELFKYYYLLDKAYEPLFWLYYHDLPNFQSREYLAETYEKYAVFLEELSDDLPDDSMEICKGVQITVEDQLSGLCDSIILNALDAIGCKFGPEDFWNNKISYFEEIKAKSDERAEFLD